MKKTKKVSDDTKEQGISQAHDQFFRTVMQDKRVASAFLKVHLPADLLAITDLDQLEIQPRSVVKISIAIIFT